MITHGEVALSRLMHELEEHHPGPKRSVLVLDLPWPWPWLLASGNGCWYFPEVFTHYGKKPKRIVPHPPDEASGALIAIRATLPLDLAAGQWLESLGLQWPSMPDDWHGSVVALAELECLEKTDLGDVGPMWRPTWPRTWFFHGLVPIEPIKLDGAHRFAPMDPAYLPELRERWQLSRWGCYSNGVSAPAAHSR